MLARTSRRLRVMTVALVISFIAASAGALAGLQEIHGALHDIEGHDVRIRKALTLAAAVRDQYAHQAHTLILGNESHLPLYDESATRVADLLQVVSDLGHDAEDAVLLQDIRVASAEMDRIFREQIVPAVRADDRGAMLAHHSRVLDLVTQVQKSADGLAARHEQSIARSEAHAAAVEHRSIRWTVILMAGATLVAVGVTLYIGRAVARPLARLEAGTERLAKGDLDTRISVPGSDEFARLAQQINRMTSSLKEQQERLVQTEKLAGIGRLAAGVAHEINNPIGVILGYARMMRTSVGRAQQDDLEIIEEEALRCRDIVEGLLDLARPLNVGAAPTDFRALVDEAVSRVRTASAMPGVRIDVDGHGNVEGNADRLRQLVCNLVRNAAEATGGDGTVNVEIRRQNERVVLEVRDSGRGLSAEALNRLYEPFFTTKPGGTGLGLAISKSIAEAHGGGITARNHASGGAVFTVVLPSGAGADEATGLSPQDGTHDRQRVEDRTSRSGS